MTKITHDEWWPTAGLRFVERDGKRILQQQWAATATDHNGYVIAGDTDWRDVPLASAEPKGDQE